MEELLNRWDKWSEERGEGSIREFFATLQRRELERLVNFIRQKPRRKYTMPAKSHGDARKGNRARLLRTWYGMRNRCNNSRGQDYPRYGGRGIKVCEEWSSYPAFKDWAWKNGYTETLSIDRIDVDGNYEPGNCRWISIQEQQRNRSNNRPVEYNGETLNVSDWARRLGLKPATLLARVGHYGWTVERAFTQPKRKHHADSNTKSN